MVWFTCVALLPVSSSRRPAPVSATLPRCRASSSARGPCCNARAKSACDRHGSQRGVGGWGGGIYCWRSPFRNGGVERGTLRCSAACLAARVASQGHAAPAVHTQQQGPGMFCLPQVRSPWPKRRPARAGLLATRKATASLPAAQSASPWACQAMPTMLRKPREPCLRRARRNNPELITRSAAQV